MDEKEREKKEVIRSLQMQWLFVVIGVALAGFLGLALNAGYELLREHFSAWYILGWSLPPALFLIDAFSFSSTLRALKIKTTLLDPFSKDMVSFGSNVSENENLWDDYQL